MMMNKLPSSSLSYFLAAFIKGGYLVFLGRANFVARLMPIRDIVLRSVALGMGELSCGFFLFYPHVMLVKVYF